MRAAPRLLGALVVLALGSTTGCASSALPVRRSAGHKMVALARRSLERAGQEHRDALLLVVLGEAEVVGVDPATGERRWRRPMRAFGRPATFGRTVVVPIRGHQIAAIDADTGALLWEAKLPGQALTGAAVSERWVVVTAIAGENERRAGARSVVAMLSMIDGRIRWKRRSEDLLGVPAAVGRTAFVPRGQAVVALALPTGRVVTQMEPAEPLDLQAVQRHDEALLATSRDALVDLYGGPTAIYRIRGAPVDAFDPVDGLEPGLGHEDGLMIRLLGSVAGAPRRALFLGRRVVIGLRFDQFGRPAEARWVHLPHDQREYVTMHAAADRVWLVEDDGTITALDAHDGVPLLRHRGKSPPRGAIFVGGTPASEDADAAARRADDVAASLVALIEDPDPRLLPAQRLATDLLWRSEHPEVRTLVREIAAGAIRPEASRETTTLREQASSLVGTPWGPSHRGSLTELAQRLSAPGKLDEGAWESATREVVTAGSPRLIGRLGELLGDPAVSGTGLTWIARSLRDLGDSRAVPSVSAFVGQYHTDPDIVNESDAIFYALEFLIAQGLPSEPARVDPGASQAARDVLQAVLDNEYTVPVVRRFVEENLPHVEDEPTADDVASTDGDPPAPVPEP